MQNPHLWTKFCLRRHEEELAAGPSHVNEQMLFHGCRKDTMAVITQEGFDIRVSGMGCALGTGTYFAGLYALLAVACCMTCFVRVQHLLRGC